MYSPSIKINFGQELDVLNAQLDALKEELSDFRPIWKGIAAIASKAFAENFRTESGLSGKWHPLDPKYLAWKLRHGYPKNILIRERVLYNALTKIKTTAGPNQIVINEKLRFAFGVTLFYSDLWDRQRGVRGIRREHKSIPKKFRKQMLRHIAKETYKKAGRAWQS